MVLRTIAWLLVRHTGVTAFGVGLLAAFQPTPQKSIGDVHAAQLCVYVSGVCVWVCVYVCVCVCVCVCCSLGKWNKKPALYPCFKLLVFRQSDMHGCTVLSLGTAGVHTALLVKRQELFFFSALSCTKLSLLVGLAAFAAGPAVFTVGVTIFTVGPSLYCGASCLFCRASCLYCRAAFMLSLEQLCGNKAVAKEDCLLSTHTHTHTPHKSTKVKPTTHTQHPPPQASTPPSTCGASYMCAQHPHPHPHPHPHALPTTKPTHPHSV